MNYHGLSTPTEHLTYTIGEIPEYAQRLGQVAALLEEHMRANREEVIELPKRIAGTDTPENPEGIIIFPIGEGEAHDYGEGSNHAAAKETEEKNISILEDIAGAWGNGSDVYGWRFAKDTKSTDSSKNPKDYYVALLKDEQGEVTAFVADTRQKNNALYIWRADASAALTHVEALAGTKAEVTDYAINGRRVLHRGDMQSRVLELLTMGTEDYMALREREREQAERKRNQARDAGRLAAGRL